jgi:hypothetical protein
MFALPPGLTIFDVKTAAMDVIEGTKNSQRCANIRHFPQYIILISVRQGKCRRSQLKTRTSSHHYLKLLPHSSRRQFGAMLSLPLQYLLVVALDFLPVAPCPSLGPREVAAKLCNSISHGHGPTFDT